MLKINNNIMDLLNNNSVETSKEFAPKVNFTNALNIVKKDNEVAGLVDYLTVEIFNLFKQGNKDDKNSYVTVEYIQEKYSKEFAKLNSLLNTDDIIVKYANNIGIYYRDKKLAYMSMGNDKLKENNHSCFLIWSMIGKITCRCMTAGCCRTCYNNCRETKNNLFGKIHNLIFSMLDVFEPTITGIIEKHQQLKGKKVYIRVHEDGDFYSEDYLEKWLNVSKNLENKNVHFMAYTKEYFILYNWEKYQKDNFNFRYSIVDDTDEKIIEYCQQNNIPTYIVLGDKKVIYGKYNENNPKHVEYMVFKNQIAQRKDGCHGSCEHCKKCYNDYVKNIFTVIH